MKKTIYILMLILCVGLVSGFNVNWGGVYNPFTLQPDYILDLNQSGFNISGNLKWTDLYDYPVACPANSAITQLNDSVTCTDGLYTLLEIATNMGNWSNDKPDYYNASVSNETYVNVDGDTMSGDLIMNANIVINNNITNSDNTARAYFDSDGVWTVEA